MGIEISPWGHLFFLLWTLLLVGLLPDQRVMLLLGSVLLFALLTGGGGLRPLRRPRFWILILSALALGPLVLGEKDLAWSWLPGNVTVLHLSRAGFWMGLWMALRALCLTVAFSVALNALSVSEMARLFEMVGLKGLGFALGVALNLLPTLRETAAAAYHTLRLRGGFRRRPWQALKLFLVTVIANALRHSDDVVNAASARAFEPTVRRGEPVRFQRADGLLAVALLGLGLGFAFWPL
ncbi:MAG: energy-coupling factor transporter transmembrane protein EcfT [Anaerolineae bacterium]|nr:energy-coupling factor transporter transmembrane protein EcfT [Anaerolineae bacterium]